MKKEKVLIFTAFVPNEAAAGEKNSLLMIKDLSQYFDVDIAYFKYGWQDEYKPKGDNVKVLKVFKNSLEIKVMNAIMHPFFYPIFTIRYNRSIKKWLQKQVDKEEYTAIVFEHSQMLLYARRLKTQALKILFSHDVMYQRVSRAHNCLFSMFCKKTESYCLHTEGTISFTISKKDATLIEKLYNVHSEYSDIYIDEKVIKAIPDKINKSYVFIGKWTRADNLDGVVWFFNNVVPFINQKIKIIILGRNFPVDKIRNSNPLIEVDIPGFVDDPYPVIANSQAMLAPIFTGAGVKVKVLESLACGTPVIGTDIAFEGIADDFKEYMILVDKPEEYAFQMGNINFTIEERRHFKEKFLKNYSKSTITEYLRFNTD